LSSATDGSIAWSAGYAAFGKAIIDPLSTIENNLRFPGQYYDQETGTYYNWHRFYDPETGRYLSADPIGLDGGMNLYAYVGGNPINAIDITGLRKCTKDISECLESCHKAYRKCKEGVDKIHGICMKIWGDYCKNSSSPDACMSEAEMICGAMGTLYDRGCDISLGACTLGCLVPSGDTPCDPCE
jgi:RHS repeat-associated protein